MAKKKYSGFASESIDERSSRDTASSATEKKKVEEETVATTPKKYNGFASEHSTDQTYFGDHDTPEYIYKDTSREGQYRSANKANDTTGSMFKNVDEAMHSVNRFFNNVGVMGNYAMNMAQERSNSDRYYSADELNTAHGKTLDDMFKYKYDVTGYAKYFLDNQEETDKRWGEGSTQKLIESLVGVADYVDSVSGSLLNEKNYYSQWKDQDEYSAYRTREKALSELQKGIDAESEFATNQKLNDYNRADGVQSNTEQYRDLINNPNFNTDYKIGADNPISNNPFVNAEQALRGEPLPVSEALPMDMASVMTRDELGVYNTILNTQGQSKANEYYHSIYSDLSGRLAMRRDNESRAFAEATPALATLFSVPYGLMSPISSVGNAINIAKTGEIDENAWYNDPVRRQSTIREEALNYYSEKYGKVGEFTYGVVTSVADNVAQMALGGAIAKGIGLGGEAIAKATEAITLGLMGTQVFSNELLEGQKLGRTVEDTVNRALLASGIELLTEKIGLDELFGGDVSKGVFNYLLRSAGAEAGEEALSTVLNVIGDWGLHGDQSEIVQKYNEYISTGFDRTQAVIRCLRDVGADAVVDALAGFVSGIALGGGGAIQQRRAMIQTGNALVNNTATTERFKENFSPMIDTALNSGNKHLVSVANRLNELIDNSEQLHGGSKENQQNSKQIRRTLGELAVKLDSESQRTGTKPVADLVGKIVFKQGTTHEDFNNILSSKEAVESFQKATGVDLKTSEFKTQSETETEMRLAIDNMIKNSSGDFNDPMLQYEGLSNVVALGKLFYQMENKAQSEEINNPVDDTKTQIDANLKSQVETLSQNYNENGAKALNESYDGSIDPAKYNEQMQSFYESGMKDGDFSGILEGKDFGNGNITLDQATAMFRAGRVDGGHTEGVNNGQEQNRSTDGQRNDNLGDRGRGKGVQVVKQSKAERYKRQSETANELRNTLDVHKIKAESALKLGIEGASSASNVRVVPENLYNESLKAIDTACKDNGVKVVFFAGDNFAIRNGGSARGYCSSDGNTIFVRADHPKFSAEQLARHELFHATVKTNPALVQSIVDQIMDSYDDAKLADIVKAYTNAYKSWNNTKTAEDIFEEILADAYAGMNLFEDRAGDFRGAEAISERVQNNTATGTEKNEHDASGKFSIEESFAKTIDEWDKNGRIAQETFVLGSTGNVLQALGAIENDIYLTSGVLEHIQEHEEMTLDIIKKIPQVIDNPYLVAEGNKMGSLVMWGNVKANDGSPIMVVMSIHAVVNNMYIDDIQIVNTAYVKDTNPLNFLKKLNFLYVDKTKTAKILRAMGIYSPITLNKSGYVGSINYENNAVNMQGLTFSDVFSEMSNDTTDDMRFSAEFDEDSDGRTLSEGQREYFKDSKAVDENGDLQVVYHGTVSDFTIFDRSFGNPEGDMGAGFYFTNNINDVDANYANEDGPDLKNKIDKYAEQLMNDGMEEDEAYEEARNRYIKSEPRTMEVYLNITNPVYVGGSNETYFEVDYNYDEETDEYGEPEGTLTEFMETMQSVIDEYDDLYDAEPDFSALYDSEYISASDLIKTIKESVLPYATDEEGNIVTSEIIRRTFEEMGYDGVIDSSVSEKFTGMRLNEDTVHYIVFNSNQAKYVDNTNPTVNEDVRFSEEITTDELKEQQKELKAQIKELTKALEAQTKATEKAQQQTKRTPKNTVSMEQAEKVATKFLKEYNSTADVKELTSAIADLGNTLLRSRTYDTEYVYSLLSDKATDVARKVIESTELIKNKGSLQTATDIRSMFRGGIVVTDEIKNGIENYKEFHQAHFGDLNVSTKEGISVPELYDQLNEKYPSYFPSDNANDVTKFTRIFDVMHELRNDYVSFDSGVATELVKNDILSAVFSDQLGRSKPTFADKKAQVEKYLRSEIERRDNEIAKKTRRVSRLESQNENRKRRELAQSVEKTVRELARDLTSNTKKHHVYEVFKDPLKDVLMNINLSSTSSAFKYIDEDGNERTKRFKYGTDLYEYGDKTKKTQAFDALREKIASVASYTTLDESFITRDGLATKQYERIVENADVPLYAQTTEDLTNLKNFLASVKSMMRNYNKTLALEKQGDIEEVVTKLNTETKDAKTIRSGRGIREFTVNSLIPQAFMHRLGAIGDSLFNMMTKAHDAYTLKIAEIADFTNTNIDTKVSRVALDEEVQKVTLGGKEVKMSTSQLMCLYVLSKRNQAMQHILRGGIRINNDSIFDTINSTDKDSKAKKLGKRVANSAIDKANKANALINTVQNEIVSGITEEELSNAFMNLTPELKNVADLLQNFLSTTVSSWGNEAHMEVYGYSKFNEENYWGIRVDSSELETHPQNGNFVSYTVANWGSAKDLTAKPQSAIVLDSIFADFTRHASGMANYSSWLAPMEDLQRIRNYKLKGEDGNIISMQKVFDRVFGRDSGSHYFDKLMRDLANGIDSEKTYFGGLFGNWKVASVAANWRVVLQQPTAIARAMDVIDPRYFLLSSAKDGAGLNIYRIVKGYNEAKQYCPIAQWKEWGYFDTNTGKSTEDIFFKNTDTLAKAKEIAMMPAGFADTIGWGIIWNACVEETKANNKDIKNMEQIKQLAGERFNEVIHKTQVVDGILQRSDLMRRGDTLAKMATSFMAEPTKQINMLMTTMYDVRNNRIKGGWRKSGKLARTLGALVASLFFNSIAQSIIDAMRHLKEDDKYMDKFFEEFQDNFMEALNPLTYFAYIKDVVSLIKGYDVERSDLSLISEVIDAYNALLRAKENGGRYNTSHATIMLVARVANLIGIPAYNLVRHVTSPVNVIASVNNQRENYVPVYNILKAQYNLNSTNKGRFMNVLSDAYFNKPEDFDFIYKDMVDNGYFASGTTSTQEAIMNSITGDIFAKMFDHYNAGRDSAYLDMFNKLMKSPLLVTTDEDGNVVPMSTDEKYDYITTHMENLAKKYTGTKTVGDLPQRYLVPEQQEEYDRMAKGVVGTSTFNSATDYMQDRIQGDLMGMATGSSDGAELAQKLDDANLSETDYALYMLALSTVNDMELNEKTGKMQWVTPTQEERIEAINSLDLSNEVKGNLFLYGANDSTVKKVEESGVSAYDYMSYITAVQQADIDGNGTASQKEVLTALDNMHADDPTEVALFMLTQSDETKDKLNNSGVSYADYYHFKQETSDYSSVGEREVLEAIGNMGLTGQRAVNLYMLSLSSTTREKVDDAGIPYSDYYSFRQALAKADKPTASGNYGSYTNAERREAIDSMNVSRETKAQLWLLSGGNANTNPYR